MGEKEEEEEGKGEGEGGEGEEEEGELAHMPCPQDLISSFKVVVIYYNIATLAQLSQEIIPKNDNIKFLMLKTALYKMSKLLLQLMVFISKA